MTSTNGSPAQRPVTVPLWTLITGGIVMIALLAGIIGYAIAQSQPSEAGLLVRAMAGDREAGEELEARHAEPESLGAAELTKAGFTPGTYREPRINALDGAEVLASYILFAVQGRIDEAMAVSGNPKSEELRDIGNTIFELSGGDLKAVTIPAVLYDPAHGYAIVRGAVKSNYTYATDIMIPGFPFLIEKDRDGRWKILGVDKDIY